MRFFSKVVFLCNLCFLCAIPLRMWEQAAANKNAVAGSVSFQPIISTVAVLGLIAIFLNIIFVLLFFYRFSFKRMSGVGKFVLIFNLLVLPFQIYYYFFSKF